MPRGCGDFLVHPDAVKDVHFNKLVLDGARLDPKLRAAIAHVHDQEDFEYHEAVDGDE
jgi:hypothetical protein